MTREEMLQALQEYMVFWEINERSPWPKDPDGGELRIVAALQAVLKFSEHEEVLEVISQHLSPDYTKPR